MRGPRGRHAGVAVAVMLLAGCSASNGSTDTARPGQAGTSAETGRSSGHGTGDRTTDGVVDCADFAAFLDQPAMPAGITDATCTLEGWQDLRLTAEFDLATLSALDDWLTELPASEPPHQDRHDDTVEYTQISFRPRLAGGADHLDVSVVPSAGGFHVTMSAFNV